MYELLEKLEALIEKWENVPYTGDYTKAAKAVCAKELREIIGQSEPKERWAQDKTSNDARIQQGYYENGLPF